MTIVEPTGEPLRISNSEIQMWLKCRRRWMLTYYERWHQREPVVTGALALGSRVHAALEVYYKGHGPLLEQYDLLMGEDKMLAASMGQDIVGLEQEGELGRLMLEGYLEWVAEEGIDSIYKVIGVEEVLATPMLGGRVHLIGKVDLRVQDLRDGTNLVLDHKLQPCDELIMTPDGWTMMGKLEVGDQIIGSSWQSTKVTGVFPQGVCDVWRVTFTDGTTVRCGPEHLWTAQVAGRSRPQVLQTSQIKARLDQGGVFTDRNGNQRYKVGTYLPAVTALPDESRRAPLSMEPYTLGAWLSDGTADGSCITDDLHEKPRLEFAGCRSIKTTAKKNPTLRGVLPEGGCAALRGLGLLGMHSHERFIPNSYLHASYPDRLMLARAMMDGDGSITKSGAVIYLTSSERLAEDFALLARSLGWAASIWDHDDPKYTYLGEIRTGRLAHRVNITTDVNPFMFSERNRPLWEKKRGGTSGKGRRDRRKRIARIEKVESVDSQCISVDAEDGLYVTAGGVLTHNTTASLEDFPSWGHLNPQLMTYQTLDFVNRTGPDEDKRLAGGVFRLLKKVKRGVRAKPPFYRQHEVRHNVFTLRSFWTRTQGTLRDLVGVRDALDAGADHRLVAYPTPTRDCRWWCPFFQVCPLMDDGSDVDGMLNDLYVRADPYAYYKDSKDDL